MEKSMTWQETLACWLRQTSYAAAWCLGLLCVAERFIPGSVLPYLNFFPLVPLTVFLAIIAPPSVKRASPLRVLGFVPLAFALVAFLFMLTSDVGRIGPLLSLAALLIALVVGWLLAYPRNLNDDISYD